MKSWKVKGNGMLSMEYVTYCLKQLKLLRKFFLMFLALANQRKFRERFAGRMISNDKSKDNERGPGWGRELFSATKEIMFRKSKKVYLIN